MTLTKEQATRDIQTKDWKLRYYEAGQGHPLILIHGSGPGATGWSNFSKNIEELAKHFHVYALDMPGWGDSQPCTKETLDHDGATIQFMDALGIKKAALVGNSMGGIVALSVAARFPDRVSHIITMGPGSSPTPRLFSAGDGPTEGLKYLQQAYRTPTPEAMEALVNIMVYDKSFATPELCKARSDAALSQPAHLDNFLNMLSNGGPINSWAPMDQLMKMQIPALLIHGRDDRVVPYEHSLVLCAHIPNSRLVLLNRCGHWAMIEHANEFNRLVTDFVANN
jgi:2-hydroxy-6-oxonona-2,4-dienedioate hydrolase